MKEKKNISTLPIKILVCFLFLVGSFIVIGTSYARYTTSVDSTKKIRLKATTFDILFDDGGEYINLTNEGPMSDQDGLQNDSYTFTIQNTSTLDAVNKITFSDVTSTIPNKYLKLAFRVDDGNYSDPITMEDFLSDESINGDLTKLVQGSDALAAESSKTYTVVLWVSSDMPNEENNTSLMNTGFRSKISVETSQYVEEET